MQAQEQGQDVDWLLAVAYVFLQTQKYSLAVTFLETVLVLKPSSAEGVRLISFGYHKQSRFKDAFNATQKWQQMPKTKRETEPKYIAHIFLLQSQCLMQLNRPDLAKKCYVQYASMIKRINPSSAIQAS